MKNDFNKELDVSSGTQEVIIEEQAVGGISHGGGSAAMKPAI